MTLFVRSGMVLAVFTLLAGCCSAPKDARMKSNMAAGQKSAVATIAPSRVASTQPAINRVAGTVRFTQVQNGVRVVAEVTGLQAGGVHGFHIHEKGDLSAADLTSAGAHYDPHGHGKHGAPGSADVHAGDLGNLTADDKGVARLDIVVPGLTIDGPNHAVVGKSVILHAKQDDLKSQPTGGSGDRIAGGVIEAVKR